MSELPASSLPTLLVVERGTRLRPHSRKFPLYLVRQRPSTFSLANQTHCTFDSAAQFDSTTTYPRRPPAGLWYPQDPTETYTTRARRPPSRVPLHQYEAHGGAHPRLAVVPQPPQRARARSPRCVEQCSLRRADTTHIYCYKEPSRCPPPSYPPFEHENQRSLRAQRLIRAVVRLRFNRASHSSD